VEDLTFMATSVYLNSRKILKQKCNQDVNINIMNIYDLSLTLDELLLTIFGIVVRLNDFLIVQEADNLSRMLSKEYSKEQLGMSMY
jgi:hypothetical protein